MSRKISSTLPGTVASIVNSPISNGQEKAHIIVEEGDQVFREIHINNTLRTETGNNVSLKLGARVEVTVAEVTVKEK
jgi:hypothetical protein